MSTNVNIKTVRSTMRNEGVMAPRELAKVVAVDSTSKIKLQIKPSEPQIEVHDLGDNEVINLDNDDDGIDVVEIRPPALDLISLPEQGVTRYKVIKRLGPDVNYLKDILPHYPMINQVSSSTSFKRIKHGEIITIDDEEERDDTVSSSGIDSEEPTGNDKHRPKKHVVNSRSMGKQTIRRRIERCGRELLKIKVMKMIIKSPSGIFCRHLIKKYWKRYGYPLRSTVRGYTSTMRTIEDVKLSVVLTRPLGCATDYLLNGAPSEAMDPINETKLGAEHIFLRSCMQIGDSIPSIPLDSYRPGQLLLATIGGITSPSEFFFVKYGANNHILLERISYEMMQFFCTVGMYVQLPRSAIGMNLYCGVQYNGVWHRACVLDIIGQNYAKVRHIDYGTEDVVAIEDVRPLLNNWSQLPMQAIRARLDGVSPPLYAYDQWPLRSVKKFEGLVLNKALFVHVMGIEEQLFPVATVALIDTSTTEDCWIDIELISLGLADEERLEPRRLHRRLA